MDLLVTAVQVGVAIRDVLVRQDLLGGLPKELLEAAGRGLDPEAGPDIGVCDPATLDHVSSLGGAADVIFSCVQPEHSLGDLTLGSGTSFYLDGVGDPGNVGTIVRSALAFRLVGVICAPGTADPYGPKAMRAGMGAQFLLPVVTEVAQADLVARLAGLSDRGEAVPDIWVADAHEGAELAGLGFGEGRVVVLGGERSGPRDEWAGATRVKIRQSDGESLNVAMAGTVFAYESSLGRSSGRGGN